MTAPAYKLFAVQESSEVYAAADAEQARAHVSALIGEEIPAEEVWEVDGSEGVRISTLDEAEMIRAAGIILPDSLRVIFHADGTASALFTGQARESAKLPRPLYVGTATVSHVVLTLAEAAAVQVKLGTELPFMVSTGYE